MNVAACLALLVLASHAAAAPAAPVPTCERVIATHKRIHRQALVSTFARDRKLSKSDRAYIDGLVAKQAKDLLAACKKFGWPATYRRCLQASTTPDAVERCYVAEYERSGNRDKCEPLLDHYMTLADADFADLYKDHDPAWIEDFQAQHRAPMRAWCIERGLVQDGGAACARAATTRAAFLACGNAD